MVDWKSHIRSIPDFPKKGIVFRDITTLLKNGHVFKQSIEALAEPFRDSGAELVVGPESRGFIFGTGVANLLNLGFIPVRKPGKLPAETESETYELEYGTDTIEMHKDAVGKGTKVLMIDDLLATGGTMLAACRMVKKLGGEVVGIGFLIELSFLKGRDKLKDYNIFTLIDYESE